MVGAVSIRIGFYSGLINNILEANQNKKENLKKKLTEVGLPAFYYEASQEMKMNPQ